MTSKDKEPAPVIMRRKTMLINGIEYELKPLEEGDEDLIEGKIGEYDHSVALPVPGAEEETLYFKITDGDGRKIGRAHV